MGNKARLSKMAPTDEIAEIASCIYISCCQLLLFTTALNVLIKVRKDSREGVARSELIFILKRIATQIAVSVSY